MLPAVSPSRRVLAVVFSTVLALFAVPFMSAADDAPAADLPALPLSATYGKGTPGENGGPYAVTVTNTSDHTLNLHGMILWSVTSHDRSQSTKLGPKQLAAGESWTIHDLAVEDRVVLEADGYAVWDKKTPPGKK